LLSFCATARNDTFVGARFGRAGQGPKMDSRRATRSVERTAVGEGERGWVSKGEGGEGFYIARSGRRADSLASPKGGFCQGNAGY
jgi:hypothetical protein